MNVRAQVSMVFHLDKCIGCHTCSLACKNLWTDRRGTEYMWWNNVETKPGTSYPTLYEDQERYRGGWTRGGGHRPRLRLGGRVGELADIFFNRRLPSIDDYYEPWTYDYEGLFDAPEDDVQPAARPQSMITGEQMEIEAGPNWDDDLGGSGIYAAADPNLKALTADERRQLFALERLVFFYLPRICCHCLNPGCLAACPAGAIYKRGEDGIVLISQVKCRAWRMCVSGCPYKKTYYNWHTGKSEKCILCYPRQETEQVPACMHSCVGRIRYLGAVLYDADGIAAAAARPDAELVEAQRALILDPSDPEVVARARHDGVPDQMIAAARKSPVYQLVKVWKIALPQHPEWRTMPMLFYVPPLLPVMAAQKDGRQALSPDFLSSLDADRLPLRYMARLFTAGDEATIAAVYAKLHALRLYMRSKTVGDLAPSVATEAMSKAGTTAEELEAIYQLTALANFEGRFVVPPFRREEAVGAVTDPHAHQQSMGAGFLRPPKRGW